MKIENKLYPIKIIFPNLIPIQVNTIHQWHRRKKIKLVKIGGRLHIDGSYVRDIIKNGLA